MSDVRGLDYGTGARSEHVLSLEVVTSVEALSPHLPMWERLAVAAGQPCSLPGWQLAWWRNLAPPGALLRAVLVFDGPRLVAVAPYFAVVRSLGRAEYRPLATYSQGIGPFAAHGMREHVAPLVARGLATADPRPSLVSFDGFDAASPWPDALRRAWPGRLAARRFETMREPATALPLDAPDFGRWLAAKSRNFRQDMRKKRRRLEQAGGHVRLARSDEDARRAIAAFVRLHHARFAQRGSHFPRSGLQEMLEDAATALLPTERLRLFTVEVDGQVVGVNVIVAAGGVASLWGTTFSDAHAALSPGVLATLSVVEDAYARGEHTVDLGWGDQDYKRRFGTPGSTGAVVFGGLVPMGPRYPLTRLAVLPAQGTGRARLALRGLPEERQQAIKRTARSLRTQAQRIKRS